MELDYKQLASVKAQRVYHALGKIPFVTIYNSSDKTSFLNEGFQLTHCFRSMAQMEERNEISWGIDMDIDELFAFGPNTAATPGCLDPRLSRNGIGKFLASVPDETVAVVVPQIRFGTSNHVMMPLTTQAEAYTRRGRFSEPSKIIVRSGVLVPELGETSRLMYPEDSLFRMDSKHSIQVKASTIDSAIVMNSFGGLAEYVKESNDNIK
jgi:hypothetical protein